VKVRPELKGFRALLQGGLVSQRVLAGSPLAVRKEVSPDEVEEVTKKYGLEAGLFSIFRSKEGGKTMKAKDLLAKYGSAYLLTSISLSIVSFSLCYALISAGVDVGALLAKVCVGVGVRTSPHCRFRCIALAKQLVWSSTGDWSGR
jgi:hypothetical protein